jgi:Uma2 family endonuclease
MHPWSPAVAKHVPPIGQRLGIEEWIALPADAPGELVDGYLVEEEVPEPVHELALTWLIALFRAWLGRRRGFVFGSGVRLVVSPTGGRKPDVSVYFPERPAPPRRGTPREPPDVVVEIVSPSAPDARRDRVEKMDDYATIGARFYWLLDPGFRSLEIFELRDGRFAHALAATAGCLTDVPGCPGLRVDLDELWSELGRLAPDE